MLLSGFDIDTSRMALYGSSSRERTGVGGTIKNVVFREVKPGRLSISTPKEFADEKQKLVHSICSLYLPASDTMEEPTEIGNAPATPKPYKYINWNEISINKAFPILIF